MFTLSPWARSFAALAFIVSSSMSSNSLAASQAATSYLHSSDFLLAKSDKRQYRALRLDNGLPVLLISDVAAQRSAATLDWQSAAPAIPWRRKAWRIISSICCFSAPSATPRSTASKAS